MRSTLNPSDKRKAFRRALSSGKIIRAPGAFLPLVAIEIERHGFEAIYLSGAVLAADLGLPDIGLTTMTEVADRAEQFARVTNLPIILDCDTGFGEPMNVARCVEIMESRGMAAVQIEDQDMPKRCGHLDGKTLVPVDEMLRRIRAASEARRDPDTVLIARTDAFANEGIDGVIARSKAYVEAGADVIFAEALTGANDWAAATKAIPAPLLANMTEFGKSDLLRADELQALGASVVIYPVTLLRLAMGTTRRSLAEIAQTGTQSGMVSAMQTRAELYDLLDYEAFSRFDSSIYNFTLRSQDN